MCGVVALRKPMITTSTGRANARFHGRFAEQPPKPKIAHFHGAVQREEHVRGLWSPSTWSPSTRAREHAQLCNGRHTAKRKAITCTNLQVSMHDTPFMHVAQRWKHTHNNTSNKRAVSDTLTCSAWTRCTIKPHRNTRTFGYLRKVLPNDTLVKACLALPRLSKLALQISRLGSTGTQVSLTRHPTRM